jgi:hypothetical protein
VKNSVQAPKETADYSDFGADSVEEFGAGFGFSPSPFGPARWLFRLELRLSVFDVD